jgi:hypothetical protein
MSPSATVFSIDNQEIPGKECCVQIGRIFVKPGTHEFVIYFDQKIEVNSVAPVAAVNISNRVQKIQLNVEAKHSYIFTAHPNPDSTYKILVKDKGTDYSPSCFEVRHWITEPKNFEKLGCD